MTEAATFAEAIDAVREQTAHLLGTTISYDEDDWASGAVTPGWTRSHVAAHLVEGALGALDYLDRLDRGDEIPLHASPADQQRALERRALDAGLSLQIQLDETSGQLQGALAKLADDDREVTISEGWRVPLHSLAFLRLRELVVHHYDLVGEFPPGLSAPILHELLRLEVQRPHGDDSPSLLITTDEGFSFRVGDEAGETTTVLGPAADLLIWIARGVASQHISGAAAEAHETDGPST